MRKSGILIAFMAIALAACGGSDAEDDAFSPGPGSGGGGGGGGGGGAGQGVQLGSGTGGSFQGGTIGISNANVAAGGSTSLSVTLQYADGTLYTSDATVTFNSPCVAQGLAEIQPESNVTTSTGVVTVTYVARGCSGPDLVTATTSVDGTVRTASGTVTVAEAAIGTIAFVSATPTNIALKGTGSGPETSTVVFRVLDAAGGPRAGAEVSFALNTSVGGITLTPASATAVSDAQGLVQIIVNAGTVPTPVRVTASVTSIVPAISTQSSQLTISTGLPVADRFSLAVGCSNVEGWAHDGVTTSVTARLADRFGNPVPDGTTVNFTAEGGAVQASCSTTTTAEEGGVCSVNWRSSNPRPLDGRVTLLAKAIGEESFVDADGDGAFGNGETFTDLSEPFRDDDEDGVYTAGTDGDFYDFNQDGIRNPPDGYFNGALCNDTAGRCLGPRSTGIGRNHVIIMSGSAATVTRPDGAPLASVTLPISSSAIVQIWVRDANGNPMPGGTSVSAAFSGSGATLGQPNSFNIPCSAIAAGIQAGGVTVFSFSLSSQATAGGGLLNITVETPLGLQTFTQIPVTVTP